jgi:hypothetical protein
MSGTVTSRVAVDPAPSPGALRAPASPPAGGEATAGAGFCASGFCASGFDAWRVDASGSDAAAPSDSSAMMTSPGDTLSPTLTLMPRTTPASGAGTSMVAFSDSSVISAASLSTRWPSLTSTSITGTSL